MSGNTTLRKPKSASKQGAEHATLNASIKNSCGKVERCIRDNPGSSMLVSLGVGLGIGVAAGMILSGSNKGRTQAWFDRGTSERLGRQLMEAFAKVVPDSISDRISS